MGVVSNREKNEVYYHGGKCLVYSAMSGKTSFFWVGGEASFLTMRGMWEGELPIPVGGRLSRPIVEMRVQGRGTLCLDDQQTCMEEWLGMVDDQPRLGISGCVLC